MKVHGELLERKKKTKKGIRKNLLHVLSLYAQKGYEKAEKDPVFRNNLGWLPGGKRHQDIKES